MEKKLNVVSIMTKGIILCTMITFVITGFTVYALAQGYPTQPITLIAGMAPGGLTDICARTIANEVKKFLGVELLVVNKPGAMQALAMSYVISSRPDGYTLGATTDAPYVRAPLFEKLSFNPLTDTIPIISYGTFLPAFYVRADSPFKNFKDVLNFAKENPGKLTFGHVGISSITYLNMAGFELQMGLKISMVPFNGDSEVLVNVLGGQIMAGSGGSGALVSQVKAGKIRVLAISAGNERMKEYPEAPTLYELGFKDSLPNGVFLTFGPKGLPEPIVKKLEDAYKKASESAEFKKLAADNEIYPVTKASTGQELRDSLAKAYQDTRKMVQKLSIKSN
jgi:tripartite-type tricarboxylate transporter receptor subunit TctC